MRLMISPERLIVVVILAACVLAWVTRWVQDDAYITFRYSENMAAGLGPVWNAGYAVEGYSNFTWMLLLAGASALGFDVVVASQVFGVLAFGVSLLLVYRVGCHVLPSTGWALLATGLTAANYSFLLYATGGLETQLMALLVLAAFLAILGASPADGLTPGRALIFSVTIAFAVMTRPDGATLGFVLGPVALVMAFRSEAPAARLAVLVLPGLALLIPWLAWKLSFYGDILPNTYYAKAVQRTALTSVRGLIYAAWPFLSFFWIVVIGWLAVVFVARRGAGRGLPRRGPVMLLAYVLIWEAYVVWVGGDIMEYRMHVQVIPLVLLLLVAATAAVAPRPAQAWPLPALLLAGTAFHAAFFPSIVRPVGISNIPSLQQNVALDLPQSWSNMGKALARDLGTESRVVLGVSPAGAIPFYSGLETVDILGLNDLWVPRNGHLRQTCTVCQAHARMATIPYLAERGVTLVLGHPQWRRSGDVEVPPPTVMRRMFYDEEVGYDALSPDASLLYIPLEDGSEFAAVYLTPSREVDALIESGVWRSVPLGSN